MTTEPSTDTRTEPIPGPTARPPARRAGRPLWVSVRVLVTTVAVLGVVTLVCPGLFGAWSARAVDAVPRSIELPWPWQASVEDDPPGLAAVVATAQEEPGMDVLAALTEPVGDAEEAPAVQVVGRNGVYRAVYPAGGQWYAGANLHLSPDGGSLALPYLHDPATARHGPTVVDLVTGRATLITASGLPRGELTVLGWRPDGGALLLASQTNGMARVVLLDVRSRALAALTTVPAPSDPRSWRAAFSPDGATVALAAAGSLRLLDGLGETLWSTPLPPGHELAGRGAFTPDGTRVALVHAVPCETDCGGAPPWAVTYVDSADGTPAAGPALPTVAASRVRAVGWSRHDDGSLGLVVVRYLPPPPPQPIQGPDGSLTIPATGPTDDEGAADLYELAASGEARLLLDAPYAVNDLDVAADLVAAGRFAGEPSMPSLLPIEAGRLRTVDVLLMAASLAGVAIVIGVIVGLTGQTGLRRRSTLAPATRVPAQRAPTRDS